MEKNRGERKKPAAMAFGGGGGGGGGGAAVASVADRYGWRNLLAGLKSPCCPDEGK